MSRHSLLRLLLAAACFAAGGARSVELEPEPQRILKLTLETALQGALARNFSIVIRRLDPQIAQEGVRSELGRFDPVWDVTAERRETSRRDVFNNGLRLQQSGNGRLDQLSSGISGVTAWGTRYDVGYGTRGNSGANSLLGDIYNTTGSIGIAQPLLRGAGSDANLADIRIARKNVQVSEWRLRSEVIDVMTQTNFVYNELHSALQRLEVAKRSRELARQLLRDNQSRVDIGVKSPLDVTEARAGVAAREEAVLLAQRVVLDNENLLKQLVTNDMLTMLGTRVEIAPPPAPTFLVDVRAGVADALALRPDYRQAILALEQQKIRVAFQKNALLPRVDLTGSIALLGLDEEFGGSLARISRRDQTEWAAGVVFSIPLGNRQARGAYNQARLESVKALVNLESLEQRIIVEIDNASGQIETSRQRITSTVEAQRLAKESLDAGQERLRAGTGTTFEVLELQEKLAQAEEAELRARLDYNNAVSEYHRQTGTTLREHGVTLE